MLIRRMSNQNFCKILKPKLIVNRRKRYFYSKTNQIHNISNLFYFRTTLYMFRTVYVTQVLWLLASKQPQNLYGMMLYVQS